MHKRVAIVARRGRAILVDVAQHARHAAHRHLQQEHGVRVRAEALGERDGIQAGAVVRAGTT
jgi:hypothetical protein